MANILSEFKIFISCTPGNLKLITPYCTMEDQSDDDDVESTYKVTSLNLTQLFMDYCSADPDICELWNKKGVKIEKKIDSNIIKLSIE